MADDKIKDIQVQIQEVASKSGAWDRGLVEASIVDAKFDKTEVINTKRGKNDKTWDLMSWSALWVKVAQATVLPIRKDQASRRILGEYDGIPYQIEIVQANSRFPAIRVASAEPTKPQIRFGYLVVDKGHVRLLVSTRPVMEGTGLVKTLIAARDKIKATAKAENPEAVTKVEKTTEPKVEEEPKEVAHPAQKAVVPSRTKRTRKARGVANKAARAAVQADMALKA